jgi:hypothetical protein
MIDRSNSENTEFGQCQNEQIHRLVRQWIAGKGDKTLAETGDFLDWAENVARAVPTVERVVRAYRQLTATERLDFRRRIAKLEP